jgi:PAS domain S-box-containing protein
MIESEATRASELVAALHAAGEVGRDLRREASEQVRPERLLLKQTLRQLPAGVILADAPSGRIVMANEQVTAILGHPLIEAQDMSEYAAYELYLPDRRTRAVEQAPLARAIRDGEVVQDEEMAYRTGDGRWITLRFSAAPVTDPSGEIVAGVVVFEDVTDRVRTERLLASQRDVMAMIAQRAPLERTLTEIVQTVERLSDRGGLASILLASADGRRLNHGAAPGLPAAYNTAIDGIEIGPTVGSCGTAAYRCETVVVTDTQTDPLWADFAELAAEHGLRACWSTPILATNGALIGTFAIYHREPVAPSSEDQQMVTLLKRTAAVAIERTRDAQARARQLSELQTSLLPPALPEILGWRLPRRFTPEIGRWR